MRPRAKFSYFNYLFIALCLYLLFQLSLLYNSTAVLDAETLGNLYKNDIGPLETRKPKVIDSKVVAGLREFRRSLHSDSPYLNPIFGYEYTMDSVPFVDETEKEYQERVRKIPIKKNHIFVLIPSYRDPDCQFTITRLFEKCKYCDRIKVGLILQLNFTSTADWDAANPCIGKKHRENIHCLYVPSNITRGTVFARYAASKFWDGEEFVLGIDSHTDFITGWDVKIIEDYKSVPMSVDIPEEKREYWLSKYIFTTYPFSMDPTLDVDLVENSHLGIPYICGVNYNQGQGNSLVPGLFTQSQRMKYNNKSNLSPSYLVGAGFMFGSYKFLWDIHFDPHAPFIWIGEEVTINMQLWTRGWNFFRPPRNYITHKYGGEKRGYVYGDLKWAIPMKEDSAQRVAYILGLRKELPKCIVSTHCLTELEEYSLGKVRTIEQWKKFTGLDMNERKEEDRCNKHFDYYTDEWLQD